MGTRKYPHGTEKENQIKRQNKFIAEAYDRFTLTFPKWKKEIYKAYAEKRGMSPAAVVKDYKHKPIFEIIQQDNIKYFFGTCKTYLSCKQYHRTNKG